MSRRRRERREAKERKALLTRREAEALEEKKARRVRIFLLVFAIVALVSIVAAIAVPLIISAVNSAVIDYDKDNLGNYITLTEEDYKNYTAKIKLDALDDVVIDDALIAHLSQYRKVSGSGKYVRPGKRALGVGDAFKHFYIGYTLDEGGNKVIFSSNVGEYVGTIESGNKASEGYIGDQSLIAGFELGLIGKNPIDYSGLNVVEGRPTEYGDYVSVTYTIIPPDASTAEENVTEFIELTPEVTDALYAVGFVDKFIGKTPGEGVTSFALKDVKGVEGMTSFTKIKVNAIYDLGDNPLTVTARFPVDYSEESLAGKVAHFDVYVTQVIYYEVPEVTTEFLKDRVHLEDEEIEALEGTTAKEKYRSYVKNNLEEAERDTIVSAVEAIMWDTYLKRVKVKYLPRGSVMEYYNDYVDEVETAYSSASSSGASGDLDGYALTYFNLGPKDDWRAYLWSVAEQRVTEKVIFYYIIAREGFTPSDEEYKALYDDVLNEYLDSYLSSLKIYPENYEKYEDYLKVREEKLPSVLAVYDEAYMRENVIYLYGIEKIVDLATVEITRSESIPDYVPLEF